MSLKPELIGPVPEETVRVARAAFPKGNTYMLLRDEFGVVFSDDLFAELFSIRGQPAEAPWRLALITLMQYAEDLSDRQAADAVRSRIDWKYALGLSLTDPGFDHSVLCEFRGRLIAGGAEERLLNTILVRCRELKLLSERGRQRTDSTHVLAAVRGLNRVQCTAESLRHALNSLAIAAPDWIGNHCRPEWVERYGTRPDHARLPKSEAKRRAYAEVIGQDGFELLEMIASDEAAQWLWRIPAVDVMRRVWVQQFYRDATGTRWRTGTEGIPPSLVFINSPHDPDAHYARKYTTSWVGYKVHLTETCDDGLPHLITHVETTAAPAADGVVVEPIHRALEEKGLLPGTHLADTGYVDAELLVASKRDYEIDLLGPTKGDRRWQARAGKGFSASSFQVDWQQQLATCPAGKESLSWTPAIDRRKNHVVKIKFSTKDCTSCIHKADCTRAARRTITIRPEHQHQALLAARKRETSADFAAEYNRRAGVEGTISQAVRGMHLRRSRYIGMGKTHLQHSLTAAAMNLVRLGAWFAGGEPEKTRRSSFVRLMRPVAYA